jgi:hypothetical protein
MMFLLIYAYLPADTHAEQKGAGRVMEITTQFFGGYLGGIAGGVGLGTTAAVLFPAEGSEYSVFVKLLIGFPIGATPGMILASSGSVYGIGQAWGRRNGKFGKTLLGASLPPLLGVVLFATYVLIIGEPDFDNKLGYILFVPLWGAFFGSSLSPVGAIAGYHLSAQPSKSAATLHSFQGTPRRNLSDCQNKEPFTFYVLRFTF